MYTADYIFIESPKISNLARYSRNVSALRLLTAGQWYSTTSIINWSINKRLIHQPTILNFPFIGQKQLHYYNDFIMCSDTVILTAFTLPHYYGPVPINPTSI